MQNANGVETNQAWQSGAVVVHAAVRAQPHLGGRYFRLLSRTSTRSVSGSVTSQRLGQRG